MIRTTARTRRPATLAVAALATTAVAAGVVTAVAGTAVAEEGVSSVVTTAVDPNDALLTKGKMPVVNEVQDWHRVAVRHTRASNAQPTSLKALGFEDKARRDFAIPGGSATSVVLTFADVAAAKDAYAEIKGWRSHTGDNVPSGGQLLYTSKNTPVEVEAGRGHYLAFVFKSDKNADEGTFEWLGATRRGAAVSLVAWRIDGQDATYEVDPTIASVQTANAKLAHLG